MDHALPNSVPRVVRRKRLRGLPRLLERYALLWLLVAAFLFFALLPSSSSSFLTVANLTNLVADQSTTAILAIAVLFPLTAAQFDISTGTVAVAASIIVARLSVVSHWSLGAAIITAIVVAVVAGAVTGAVVAYIGTSAIITTLGTSTLIGGLLSLYSGDQTTVVLSKGLLHFGNATWLRVPYVTWVLIGVALLGGALLRLTVWGRHLLQIGSNVRSARLVGVRVEAAVLAAFVVGAALSATAGVLILARTGSGNPVSGVGFSLTAVAAAFLGSTVIRPGQFNVLGTIVAVYFLAILVNGLTLAGANSWVGDVVNGSAIAFAIITATLIAKRRGRRASAF